jgi:bifunctional enzyme CysN/CysC
LTVSDRLPDTTVTGPTALVFGGSTCDPKHVGAGIRALGADRNARFDAAKWFAQPTDAALPLTPVIVLDATLGLQLEDRMHAHLIRFLGLSDPVIFVGNLDQIGFEQEQFDLIEEEIVDLLRSVGSASASVHPLPLHRPDLVPWQGDRSPSVALHPVTLETALPSGTPLRFLVTLSKSNGDSWRVEGQMLFGSLKPGSTVLSSPSNQVGVIRTLSASEEEGGETSLTFDEPFFAEPGEVLSYVDAAPVETDVFRVKALWQGHPQSVGDEVLCKTAYGQTVGTIQSIEQVLDLTTNKVTAGGDLAKGCLAEIVIRANQILAIDHTETLPEAGWIQLTSSDDAETSLAVGHISMEGYADQRNQLTPKPLNTTPVHFSVEEKDRAARNGHEGGVLWFTGLSGSGKSTLAVALEARLFEKGYQVFVLDGDNVRQGLTANLGFSPDDRSENIRRVGEVAALFRQAGTIVISSFISPYRSDRDRARHAAYSSFHEIHIKAGIDTCIKRDPKGLYERALKGDIPDFTGISAPYEAPTEPELVIDTETQSIEACVEELVNYVDRNFRV